METVSVTRQFDDAPDRIRSVFGDVAAFFDVAGFDVRRDGNRLVLTKRVAVTRVELDVRLLDDGSAVLAYEQVSGPFETMKTHYTVDHAATGSRLGIETAFEAPASGFGSFLTGAVVKRQRRAEFDAVASLLAKSGE